MGDDDYPWEFVNQYVELTSPGDSERPDISNIRDISEWDDKDKLEYIIGWFLQFHEDPANQTPHISREGGYQFIWGGPYDARDVIGNNFYDQVSDEVIDQAVEYVERYSFIWAPSSDHPDMREDMDEDQTEDTPALDDLDAIVQKLVESGASGVGSLSEIAEREEIKKRLDELETKLAEFDGELPSLIGHNRPPEPIDDAVSDNQQIDELREIVGELKESLNRQDPDVVEVARKTASLRDSIGQTIGWVKETSKIPLTAYFTAVAGKAGLESFPTAKSIIISAYELAIKIAEWLWHVAIPF